MAKGIKAWAWISAGVMALGACLPWVSGLASISLINSDDGVIILAVAVLAILGLVWKPMKLYVRLAALVYAGLMLYEAVYFYVNINSGREEAGMFAGLITVGSGLYVSALAAASLAVWVFFTFFPGGEREKLGVAA